jgi:hypothetical protein
VQTSGAFLFLLRLGGDQEEGKYEKEEGGRRFAARIPQAGIPARHGHMPSRADLKDLALWRHEHLRACSSYRLRLSFYSFSSVVKIAVVEFVM